jgi:hypothetical protein
MKPSTLSSCLKSFLTYVQKSPFLRVFNSKSGPNGRIDLNKKIDLPDPKEVPLHPIRRKIGDPHHPWLSGTIMT